MFDVVNVKGVIQLLLISYTLYMTLIVQRTVFKEYLRIFVYVMLYTVKRLKLTNKVHVITIQKSNHLYLDVHSESLASFSISGFFTTKI